MLAGVGGLCSVTLLVVDESTKFWVIFDNGGVVDPISTLVLSHGSLLTSAPFTLILINSVRLNNLKIIYKENVYWEKILVIEE